MSPGVLELVPARRVGALPGVPGDREEVLHPDAVTHVLQVCLPDQRRVIAHLAQLPHEGVGLPVEGDSVFPRTVSGGLAAGQDRGAVRHADRIRDVGPVEAHPPRGEPVEVGRLHGLVAAEARVIRPMLVRDDEEEVRTFPGHGDSSTVAPARGQSGPRNRRG